MCENVIIFKNLILCNLKSPVTYYILVEYFEEQSTNEQFEISLTERENRISACVQQ